jgi:hypothetical protein
MPAMNKGEAWIEVVGDLIVARVRGEPSGSARRSIGPSSLDSRWSVTDASERRSRVPVF